MSDDQRMADGESQGADLVKAVGQAVGLYAGAVALVYMVGGAVLALQLYIEDLPSRTIVAQLSRDLLVSVGLAQVVLPGIAMAAVYAAFRTLRGATAPPKRLVDEWVHPHGVARSFRCGKRDPGPGDHGVLRPSCAPGAARVGSRLAATDLAASLDVHRANRASVTGQISRLPIAPGGIEPAGRSSG